MTFAGAFKYAGLVLNGIAAVEHTMSAAPGRAKQDAVVDSVQALLPSVDVVAGSDLADDRNVQQAIRSVTDSIVAFENIVAQRRAALKAKAA